MKTGIIIPCYNEEKRLDTDAFLTFIKENSDYHLCFVNDGSKDNTDAVLRGMKSQAPNDITIIDVKKNMGKATAVRAGARYLYNVPSIARVGFMDADLSTDFKDFKEFEEPGLVTTVSYQIGHRSSFLFHYHHSRVYTIVRPPLLVSSASSCRNNKNAI